MKVKVDYDFLDQKYDSVRVAVIDHIVKNYDLSEEKAIGIVDYENSKIVGEVEHNQVKDFMEQDMMNDRPYNIKLMAEMLLCNDEGRYQLDIK